MPQQTSSKERLVWYRGKIWSWWGLTDADGRLDLVDLRDTSSGTSADPDLCRELTGKEYKKQMDAIQWFRNGQKD